MKGRFSEEKGKELGQPEVSPEKFTETEPAEPQVILMHMLRLQITAY